MHWNPVHRSANLLLSQAGGFWLIIMSFSLLLGTPWLIEKAATSAFKNRLERSAMGLAQELSSRLEVAENNYVRAVVSTPNPEANFEKIAARWLADSEDVVVVRLMNASGHVIRAFKANRFNADASSSDLLSLPVNRITLVHAIELLTPAYSALYTFQDQQLVDLFIPVDAVPSLTFVLTLNTDQWSRTLTTNLSQKISMRVVPFNNHLNTEAFNNHLVTLPAWEGLWSLQFQSMDPLDVLLTALRPSLMLLIVLIVGSFYFHWRNFRARQKTESELLEKSQLLEKQNRLSMLGEMSASLAHEINQPLASIANYAVAAQLKLQQTDPENALFPLLQKIHAQSQRAAQVLIAVRSMLHPAPIDSAPVNVADLITALEPHLSRMCKEQQVMLQVRGNAASKVNLNAILFEQVLINLVKNSIQALETTQSTNKRICLSSAVINDRLQIEVSDNGPGIPSELAARVFESFFTTKKEGLGIGLNLCKSVIERFNGQLSLKSNNTDGACFLIDLPLATFKQEGTSS